MGFGDDCVHASQRILHEVRYSLFPSRFTFAVIRNAVTIPNESTSSPWVRNVIPSEQSRHQDIDSIHPANNRHKISYHINCQSNEKHKNQTVDHANVTFPWNLLANRFITI